MSKYLKNFFTAIQENIARLKQYLEANLPILHHHTKENYTKLSTRFLSWQQEFKQADKPKRWQMVKKPVVVIVGLFLLIKFGPLFTPPRIITTFPGNMSSEAPLDSKIEIIFNKGVIKSLAERSLDIKPNISGNFSWEGNQKLVFTPKNNLGRASSYKISFRGVVLSNFFVPLIGNKTITFETLGNPKVVLASPQNEALEDFTPITVVFDRPMIALTTATNSAIKKPAFSLNPEIEGEGRWLGTTAYQYRPSEPFKKATTYSVSLPELQSQDGGKLQNVYRWEFSSERPHVEAVSPLQNEQFASPTASVSAIFNQNVNESSIIEKFHLLDASGNRVPGRVALNGRIFGFYPSSSLLREKSYRVQLDQGVQSADGPNGMETGYTWSFTVAPKPQVVSSTPKNGDRNISEEHSVRVVFRTPMDEESFENNVLIDPQPETKPNFYFSSYENTNTLSIGTYLGRSKTYTITIGHAVKDQYGVPLDASYTFSFTTAPYKPSVNIFPQDTYFGSFNQNVVPRIVAQVVNANRVDFSLYKLKKEEFLDLYRRRYENQCGNNNYGCQNWQSYDAGRLEKIRSWGETYGADLNTPVHVVTKVTTNSGDKLPAGFYFLDLRIPQGAHDNMIMIVSKSTLTVKKSAKQIFTWAVDQSSNDVISNMNIQLTDSSGKMLTQGNTNNDGVFMKDVDLFQKNNLFVFGQKDDDIVIAADIWSQGIDRSDFGLPSYYNPDEYKEYDIKENYKLFLTLDRPIYRPGQKVYFKGVIRKDNDGDYENIRPGEKISVTINDAQNKSVSMQSLSINTFGSFSGEFILSKDANLGYYQVGSTFQGNSFTQQFQVEEYKRPDLAVTVKPSKDTYLQGENATIAINSSYYFGSPVTDAPLTWTLQTQDYSIQWDKDWRFEFGDPDSYWSRPWWDYSGQSYFSGEKVTEGKGKTNEKGDLEITIPLDISKQKTSQRMVIEATVNDISNQSIAASHEFIVHKAGLYAGLRPISYANQSGKESRVEVVTVDMKGKEVANTPVSIEFYKRTWETIREKNPDDGLFYYTSKPNDTLVSSTTVTTDSLGRATASFTPSEGGTYKVVGKVSDKNGNQNLSGSFLWVSGLGFSAARENNDRIVVVTDKRDYLVGENLSVFVASPYASDSAKTLLTAERGSVLDYKVVDIDNTSNNFSMSIPPKYTPNVFIGAVLIRGGNQVKKPAEFKIGYAEIKVTDKKQQVDVRITTDKKRYKPKETLRATIETKDLLGHPISAELAVGLVDKAVWDLSLVELPDIYKTFYQPRNLEVETSQLLTISLDRVNANTDLGAKGGSGGGGDGGSDTSRRDFPETAYWNPSLKTDKDGKASVEIKLPDNLTTWRLAAIANSQDASFGSKVSEVITSRDVLIRPFLPRFLSVGDQAKLGAIIVNTSGEDQTITAKIEEEGIQITDGKTKQQVLADGAQTKITWSTIAKNAASAKIKLSVEGSDKRLRDALEMTLPIKSYSIPEVVATAGEAKDTAQEKIVLPKAVDTTQGQTSIVFSPSLGSASFNALAYLFDYPYYCAEQITSRFMPAVFVQRILKNAKIDKNGLIDSRQLEQVINDSIQRLNNQQHPDGGWGWWQENESDPFLTAYAFLGLFEAKKDKFTVADQTLQRAQTYLVNQLARGKKEVSLNTQAYILYVLRGRGINMSSYAANLFERRFELSLESRAYLVLAMKDISGMGDRAKRLFNELISLAKKTATTTHWEEPKRDYYFMGSNTSTTASILEALVGFDKKNPLIPEVVRYLMSIRTDNHWASTRDTAAVIKAISSQLLSRADQRVDENYRLALNGKILKEGKFTKDDLFKLEQYVISISQLNIGGENKLQISKSGQGNLYYDVNLKYYLPFSEIKPLEQGIVVVREFVDSQGKTLPMDTIFENTEVWVRLIIVTPEERRFVVIEDILPAGLESVNESLKNVSALNKESPSLKEKGNQLLYFGHKEYHDDRTTLFANYLPPGVYEVTYRVRATTPGRYHHPPAQAYQMYIPDISGHSEGGWLEVK
ncbi:Ig-like domain-containing protein [Candidatus Roizmanbacteria bacterium]|nr:Ig-like domain-containing protein [Candidatus Roizmanbacteria bacterium]